MGNNSTIILDAYTIKNTDSILALADGIILTGGEDINPIALRLVTDFPDPDSPTTPTISPSEIEKLIPFTALNEYLSPVN